MHISSPRTFLDSIIGIEFRVRLVKCIQHSAIGMQHQSPQSTRPFCELFRKGNFLLTLEAANEDCPGIESVNFTSFVLPSILPKTNFDIIRTARIWRLTYVLSIC